jgi:hypothetical protein
VTRGSSSYQVKDAPAKALPPLCGAFMRRQRAIDPEFRAEACRKGNGRSLLTLGDLPSVMDNYLKNTLQIVERVILDLQAA